MRKKYVFPLSEIGMSDPEIKKISFDFSLRKRENKFEKFTS